MNKLVLVGIVALGVVAGGVAGFVMKPETPDAEEKRVEQPKAPPGNFDFVRLDRQFVVPIIEDQVVRSLVVLELSLEIAPASSERVYAKEPKIRDALLAQLHLTAQEGGFLSRLGTAAFLQELREDLKASLVPILADDVHGVLIGNIVRRDV